MLFYYKLKLKYICTHAFGCKYTEINEEQRCNYVFIFIKSLDGNIISVIFKDGKDYIGYPNSLNEIVDIFNDYINKGWTKLSSQEIKNYAGVNINYFTKINRL